MNTHTRAITGCSYWRGLTWNSLPEWWWLCYSSSTPSISVAPLHLLLLLYCHSSSPSPLLLLHPLSLFCFIFEFVPSLQWNSTNTLILFFSHPVSLIYFLRVPSLLSPSSLPPFPSAPIPSPSCCYEEGSGESIWRIPADQTNAAWLLSLYMEQLYPNKAGLFN